jgi:hypothetical protein
MKLYVYSTLAADVNYTHYAKGGGDLPIADRSVIIKGGAGVANDRLVTPHGVATEIEAEDLVFLEQNEIFRLHRKNGFIKVEEKSFDVEAVTGDMNAADPSRPPEEADFTDGDDSEPKPSTGIKPKSGKK